MKISRTAAIAFSTLTFLVSVSLHADIPSRLIGLSTRAQVGAGANIIISGFAIGPGANKTVLIRAVGPTLAQYNVPGVLADPRLEIHQQVNNVDTIIATNDNWSSSVTGAGVSNASTATFAQVGAFALPPGSNDAALVATLPPGVYTAEVIGAGTNNTGIGLLEVYDLTGSGAQLTSLSSRMVVGTGANIAINGLAISPGGSRNLLIRAVGPTLGSFGVGGVLPDPVLTVLDTSGVVRAQNTVWTTGDTTTLNTAFQQAGAFALAAGAKDSATMVNLPSGNYTIQVASQSGQTGVALVEVYDITPSSGFSSGSGSSTNGKILYIANLKPAPGVTGSTASGTATILYDPTTNTATVNVSFTNLSSAQVVAHLELGLAGQNATYVLNLAQGQVVGQTWTFDPSGQYSSAAIINALKNGQIFVEIDSANYPNGELTSQFIQSAGSQAFTAPAAAPAMAASVLGTNTDATNATRFLTQATFGPTQSDINTVMSQGISNWINAQLALPATSHLKLTQDDATAFPNPMPASGTYYSVQRLNRQSAWWKAALSAPDQLRQRVAFALSEILVTSDVNSSLSNYPEAMATYYDLLVKGAFGNFRTLIEDVTLSPVMGLYLSSLRNQKGDPVKGTSADENYAREIQQLFTIGLNQLQPDGTLKLDGVGLPIATYDQSTIVQTAKVFTGWSFSGANNNFFAGPTGYSFAQLTPAGNGWISPMQYYDTYHDKTAKTVVGGNVIPAGQTGPADLKMMLDILFNHSNTGPFISQQLIQHLVTSNPSPAYVYRVAQVFANDGTGVRGNMGAVVNAVLTDYEARVTSVTNNVGYGKLKEPLLRLTGLFRALNASNPSGRYLDNNTSAASSYNSGSTLTNPEGSFEQASMRSQTVFNFFSPTFILPGPLAAAGLYAPEYQITDATSAITVPNILYSYVYRTPASYQLTLDFTTGWTGLAATPSALVDRVNLLFAGNLMGQATHDRIATAVSALQTGTTDLEKVRTAIHLAITAPEGAVQK